MQVSQAFMRYPLFLISPTASSQLKSWDLATLRLRACALPEPLHLSILSAIVASQELQVSGWGMPRNFSALRLCIDRIRFFTFHPGQVIIICLRRVMHHVAKKLFYRIYHFNGAASQPLVVQAGFEPACSLFHLSYRTIFLTR